MAGQPEQHVNEGCCRFCGARLSLVKRMSRQEFCSSEHRDAYAHADGGAALERLQETARLKPPTGAGAPRKVEVEAAAPVKQAGSILGLSAPPPKLDPPPGMRKAQPEQAGPPLPPPAAAVRPAAPAPPPPPPSPASAAPAAAPPAAPVAAPAVPGQTMALARTKARPKPAQAGVRGGSPDAALSRLMELGGSADGTPQPRAPMRFGPERFAMPPVAEPEPEVVRPPAASPPPSEAGMPQAAPLPVPATAAPAARAPEPEEEPVTVEKRGARPPSSFVLTGQLAYGSRKPRWEDTGEWEPVALTPTALPPLVLEESDVAYLKIDGESVPGTVGEPRAVAGDLMTILVVRAAPSLLPGLMELPKGPEAEPNDWDAFKLWVRERQRQQDGPDPAEAVEMPAIAPRWIAGSFVQALFGADRYWPNPKTYIVYPTRELVRRPLLQHADLPAGQDTVPLLVTRQYEAAHRRVMAEWNPADGGTSIPSAGAVPAEVAPRAGAAAPASSQLSKPASPALPSPPREVGGHIAAPAGQPRPNGGQTPSGQPSAMGETGTQTQVSSGSGYPGLAAAGAAVPETHSAGFRGGLSTGLVLPRFGLRPGPAQERPFVVLHRQPPVARMVTLELEPADREAGPAPAPPMVAADPQPEIRHTPSGHPAGRFGVALRMPSLVGLTGTERDSLASIRGDEESMDWNRTAMTVPAVPIPKLELRRARVPVPRTAVRLAGADRAFELFLSPAPVDFTANVDQWSAL